MSRASSPPPSHPHSPSSNVRPFPASRGHSPAHARTLTLDPDDLASHGPPPLARPREMPYLDFDIYVRQGQLSDSGFEGDLLTIGRRQALGLPVSSVKCREIPRWVQLALRRQSLGAEQDTAWLAVEAALARLLISDEVVLWSELSRTLDDPAQDLPVELGSDISAAFFGGWNYALDGLQSDVYDRDFRVPDEISASLGTVAAKIHSRSSQLFLVLLLDGLRVDSSAFARQTMTSAVSGYYRLLRKRVQRFAGELTMAIREGEIVPTDRLVAVLDETERRLWKTGD